MKQYKVTKTIDGKEFEMVADESQLPFFEGDSRFRIGEEIKQKAVKKGKENIPDISPPAELPQ